MEVAWSIVHGGTKDSPSALTLPGTGVLLAFARQSNTLPKMSACEADQKSYFQRILLYDFGDFFLAFVCACVSLQVSKLSWLSRLMKDCIHRQLSRLRACVCTSPFSLSPGSLLRHSSCRAILRPPLDARFSLSFWLMRLAFVATCLCTLFQSGVNLQLWSSPATGQFASMTLHTCYINAPHIRPSRSQLATNSSTQKYIKQGRCPESALLQARSDDAG